MAAKSSLKNMLLCLTGVCLACSALLAFTYALTFEPVAAAQQAKTNASIARVLPEFTGAPELKTVDVDGQTFSYYDAGTELSYDVSIAGQGTNTYTAEFLGQTGARVDKVTIEIDPVEVGFYTVTVHEVDSSVVMATIEIYVNK